MFLMPRSCDDTVCKVKKVSDFFICEITALFLDSVKTCTIGVMIIINLYRPLCGVYTQNNC